MNEAEEDLRLRTQELESLLAAMKGLMEPRSFQEKTSLALKELLAISSSEYAFLRLYDPTSVKLRLVNFVGASVFREKVPRVVSPGEGMSGAAYQRGKPIVVEDYPAVANPRADLLAMGIKSLVSLPVKARGEVVGTITLGSRQARHFQAGRLRLLSTVAGGLGVAMDNARLQEQSRVELERNRWLLEAFEPAAEKLALVADPDRALQEMVDLVRSAVGARYATLGMWDSRGTLSHWYVSGTPREERARVTPPGAGPGVLQSVLDATDALRTGPRSAEAPVYHSAADRILEVPIRLGGDLKGAFILTDKQNREGFSPDDERLLQLFGVLAVVLMGNARLYGQAERERMTLTSIQESMTEGLIIFGADGLVLFANQAAAALWGRDRQALSGMTLQELLGTPETDFRAKPEFLDALREVLAGVADAPVTGQQTLLRPAQKELLVTGFPILPRAAERMAGLLIRDVTVERDLEQRRDSFVSVASHELRTPMSSIMGFSELLLARSTLEPTHKGWLEHIHRESRRMTGIIEDLLDVSRIQSGVIKLRLETLKLPDIVEEVIVSLQTTTDKHTITAKAARGLPPVTADRDKLAQVLVNLVGNAIKYSPAGGAIEVSMRHQPERRRVLVGVSDQGIGIAPEDSGRLFSTFERIRRPETEGIGGTGLGLYVTKGLLDLMHGEIWLESQLNKGSTFFFTLPTGQAPT